MNIASKASVALSLTLLLSGCVSTNAALLGSTASNVVRPQVPPEQVSLYRTASQVPGRYEEVALLNSSGDSLYTNESQMLKSMRKKAGQLGANGVILDALSEPSAGAKVAAAIFWVSAERKGKAIAIYVYPNTSIQPPGSPQALVQPNPEVSPQNSNQPQPQPLATRCVACEQISNQH